MTEERLKKIHKNNIRMEYLADKYKEKRYHAMSAEINMSGMPSGSGGEDNTMGDIDEAVDIETEYRALFYENEPLIKEARRYIAQFPDPILRMILELKYINGMDEWDVSLETGVRYKTVISILRTHWNNVF